MGKGAELVNTDAGQRLYVDGEPFLILSFQLDCDSCYCGETIRTLMKNAKKMGCTGVSLLLYWRLIEPMEGVFHMDILREMVLCARELDLRIVLVWFGSYKNGCMHYAPDWIIQDRERFRRAVREDGSQLPFVACPNGKALLEKDRRAVCRVFEWLKENDEDHRVILFQVNNETGLVGEIDRCHCPECEKLYKEGCYTERFPENPEEIFTAESILRYQEEIARSAKSIYYIPCYMNCWLAFPSPDSVPGFTYPCGGPVYRVMDIYRKNKKYIDFVSPDIYVTGYRDFHRICGDYTFEGNPLYVAEHGLGKHSRAYKNVYYALGEFAALGFDPWAIDCAYPDVMEPPLCDFVHERWNSEAYDMLESFVPIRDAMIPIAENQGTDKFRYWVQEESEEGIALDFGDVFVKVDYCNPDHGQSRGMAIRTGKNEFLILGCKAMFCFLDKKGKKIRVKDSWRGHFEKRDFIKERRNTIAWNEEAHVMWVKECGVTKNILDLE